MPNELDDDARAVHKQARMIWRVLCVAQLFYIIIGYILVHLSSKGEGGLIGTPEIADTYQRFVFPLAALLFAGAIITGRRMLGISHLKEKFSETAQDEMRAYILSKPFWERRMNYLLATCALSESITVLGLIHCLLTGTMTIFLFLFSIGLFSIVYWGKRMLDIEDIPSNSTDGSI